jgi:hypothetical protein
MTRGKQGLVLIFAKIAIFFENRVDLARFLLSLSLSLSLSRSVAFFITSFIFIFSTLKKYRISALLSDMPVFFCSRTYARNLFRYSPQQFALSGVTRLLRRAA